MPRSWLLLLIAIAALPCSGFAATIETIAGGGIVDGVAATSGTLSGPIGIVMDGAGNIYIGDEGNNRVRKIDAVTGAISTIAGSANSGFLGDGGPATQAGLTAPRGLALNAAGTVLYIADSGNNAVRAVNLQTQIITTVAGTSKAGFDGDGGPATAALLNTPIYVAVDKTGNLYISDSVNLRVRKVDASGTITTFAGNGAPGSTGDGGPAASAQVIVSGGVGVDGSGNVYICSGRQVDLSGNVIRKVDTSGTISTICGTGVAGFSGDGGPAKSAQCNYPIAITADAAGNLYFADNSNAVIRKIDTAGTITTVAGTPEPSSSGSFGGDGALATSAGLSNPQGVAVNAAGDLFISDSGNNRIRKVLATTKIIQTIAGQGGSGDGGPATAATINRTHGVVSDAAGNIYISAYNESKVRRVDAVTGNITTIAGNGVSGFGGDGGPAASSQLSFPEGLAIDRNGDLIICDAGNQRVRKITLATNVITTIAGAGSAGFTGDGAKATLATFNSPSFVAVDSKNQYYITDYFNHAIRRIDTSGNIATIAGTGAAGFSGDGGAATAAQLNQPDGIALDPSDNIYFADYGNYCVRMIAAATGKISTVAGTGSSADNRVEDGNAATAGSLFHPSEVAVNSTYLYINERDKSVVRVVSLSSGKIGPFAGTGVDSFLGDHGPATAARLSTLDAIAQDSSGRIFICDLFRVRRVSDAGTKQIDIAPFPTRPGIITNFSTSFALSGTTAYSWDFGDGGSGAGASLTHVYAGSGQYVVMLTASNGTTSSIFSREVLVLAPADNGGLIGNVGTTITPPKVPGVEAVGVVSSAGGVLEFGVDSSSVTGDKNVLISNVVATTSGAATAASTRSLNLRGLGVGLRDDTTIEARSGVSFVQKFPAAGLYVVESKHFGADNSVTGHGRKTVAITPLELGAPLSFTDDRPNSKVTVSALKGTFQLSNTKTSDAITLKALFALPTGMDPTKVTDIEIGMGNIIDLVTIDAKGNGKTTLNGNLKTLKIAYKKGKTGKTAGLSATFSKQGLVAAGFDTEGITAAPPDLAGKKNVARKIQLVILFGGLSYETQANVLYSVKSSAKAGTTGSINFNRNGS